MHYYIGIDLGTSSMKLLLTDTNGTILRSVTKEYPLMFPHPGWSEQDPQCWKDALFSGIPELICGFAPEDIYGLGCGGQMHGLVILDEDDNVLRPAILWNDGRTDQETAWLNEEIGKERLSHLTSNIAFAGFTAPKLLWVKKNEPEIFARISKIMLPKDYINYVLTGVHSCDYSDASGMLLLDVKNKCWSEEMLKICGISRKMLPALYESWEIIGNVTPETSDALGLTDSVRVCAGAGDNAAAAIGTGTVGNGACNISLGTSGTVFISSQEHRLDEYNSLHAFAHADGRFHLMGCILSAASCNKWLCDNILHSSDYASEQITITDEMLGRNHVFFLPYLMGERSPINDTDARGTFTGITMDTKREDMVQAVLEGVAFCIRDNIEIARKLGIEIHSSCLCGGGAKSSLWRKILANVLNIDLVLPESEEGPGYGSAMLAMTGCGEYSNIFQCAEALVKTSETVHPDYEIAQRYEKQYTKFRRIYPAMKDLFPLIH